MRKSHLTGQVESVFDLLYGMFSADNVQCLLVHSLGINGNPVNVMIKKYLQLLSGNAVRTACFHRKLLQVFCVETALDLGQQTIQLIRLQCGRCAASNVNGI